MKQIELVRGDGKHGWPPHLDGQNPEPSAGVKKAAVAFGGFVNETDEKYKVSEKASAMGVATKTALLGFFNKAKEQMATQEGGQQ